MPGIDIWRVVHDERSALAADLASLSEQRVVDAVPVQRLDGRGRAGPHDGDGQGHTRLLLSQADRLRLQLRPDAGLGHRRREGASGAETLSHFEGVITSEKRPPGPKDTILGETIVHTDDIRRALDLQHDYPTDAVVEVVDFYKGSNLILGTKRRISGLALRATDTDWSHGSGPEVAGPILALLMAMTGRKAVLDQLSGDGVVTLRERQ